MTENRFGGLTWILSGRPGAWGLLLDGGCRVLADGNELHVTSSPADESAAIVITTSQVRSAAHSTFKTSRQAVGPRQSVAIENARLHILPSGWSMTPDGKSRPRETDCDLNDDGAVNAADVAVWLTKLLASPAAPNEADISGDGLVDEFDVLELIHGVLSAR